MYSITLLVCLVLLFNFLNCELVALVVIYRHGSRGPVLMYNNDPYKKNYREIWPQGFQQLTNRGKNQQFALGKWYRRHYKDFIPTEYHHEFTRVMSSDVDRCLMSAASNLAGLFPPRGEQVWTKSIPWQPIPIHTTPYEEDPVLAVGKPCPKHAELMAKFKEQEEYRSYFEKMRPAIDYILKKSGETSDEMAEIIHDTLFVESYFDLPLPKWTNRVFPNITWSLMSYAMRLPIATPQLTRLKAGPVVDYITSFFEKVTKNPEESQKFLMLSAHDITLVYLLQALGLYDGSWPEYASSVNFELHSTGVGEDEKYLDIYFKNSTVYQKLTLEKCGAQCEFSEFTRLIDDVRMSPENWQKECFNV
ncbi:unnamed protein product [Phyllotreta striolata]|uniref:acid phosphatase n=1 Tax=Phyllotreta striolata TaxID=444603 RepID=A0A9N9TNS7_PHYSR|nr:unnamed protein product [Phyllotreta striolata]